MNSGVIFSEGNIGCWLDNHRGHYIVRDVIELAVSEGFIIGPFEKFVIDGYDRWNTYEDYPHEAVSELCDAAIEWLNSGHVKCHVCDGKGRVYATGSMIPGAGDGGQICKNCSGSGRGGRIDGQNFPPQIPTQTAWGFNDGDFGLYPTVVFTIVYEDQDNVRPVIADAVPAHEARQILKDNGVTDEAIERALDATGDDMATQVGGYIVTPEWNDN